MISRDGIIQNIVQISGILRNDSISFEGWGYLIITEF